MSVRNEGEALAAAAGGADLIDLKEPARGALGPVDHATALGVVRALDGVSTVTAAWGELREAQADRAVPAGVSVVKVGLAGAATDWRSRVGELRDRLSRGVELAVAAYADTASGSPRPLEVAGGIAGLGVRWLVIDTWDKAGGSSLDLLGAEALREVIDRARSGGARVVLAGSLRAETLAEAAAVGADVVGVRGAACRGGREGVIDTRLVAELRRRLDAECRATLVRPAPAGHDATAV